MAIKKKLLLGTLSPWLGGEKPTPQFRTVTFSIGEFGTKPGITTLWGETNDFGSITYADDLSSFDYSPGKSIIGFSDWPSVPYDMIQLKDTEPHIVKNNPAKYTPNGIKYRSRYYAFDDIQPGENRDNCYRWALFDTENYSGGWPYYNDYPDDKKKDAEKADNHIILAASQSLGFCGGFGGDTIYTRTVEYVSKCISIHGAGNLFYHGLSAPTSYFKNQYGCGYVPYAVDSSNTLVRYINTDPNIYFAVYPSGATSPEQIEAMYMIIEKCDIDYDLIFHAANKVYSNCAYTATNSSHTPGCAYSARNTKAGYYEAKGQCDSRIAIKDAKYCVIELTADRAMYDIGLADFLSDKAPFVNVGTFANQIFSAPDAPDDSGGYPYEPTPPHGGNGEQDFSSDEIPNPTSPAWSAVACGLCKAYSPTLAEVQAMAGELWSSDFVDSMKKLYNDPMEAVISFGTIPVKPNTADTTTPLVVGNYTFTSASARPVTSNFVTVDCGEVTLPKQYDGFQDYEPYTKIQIYLPFIGNQTVTPSDVVGKPAHLYYRIDVLTGACLAWLSVDNRVLYQWTGNCFTEIPLSKNSKSQIYSQIIHGIVNTITSTAQGGVAGGAVGAALGGVSGIISTITDVATSKHSDVMRTGALNPASSTLGVRTPYFIISYPTMVTPEGYAAAKGIPVNAGGTIGEFSGYTVVDSVHLENIAATENEIREIESLLTGGVIL